MFELGFFLFIELLGEEIERVLRFFFGNLILVGRFNDWFVVRFDWNVNSVYWWGMVFWLCEFLFENGIVIFYDNMWCCLLELICMVDFLEVMLSVMIIGNGLFNK